MEDQEEWSVDDEPCEEALGTCQNSTNFCNGKYEDGMCGGPGERKCCDTKQEGGKREVLDYLVFTCCIMFFLRNTVAVIF